jgi:hypothetical protein
MSRKNAVKSTPKTVTSARKKATSPRRTTGAQDLAPTAAEALPSTPAEPVVVAEPVVAAPEAVVEAVAVTVAVTVVEAAPRTIARAEFEAAVRREAFLSAERRGFRNGSAFEDWIRAERGVRARLAAEGVAVA